VQKSATSRKLIGAKTNVDIDEYLNRNPPKAKQSALTPHTADIFKLREKGMSLQQIMAFLAENGITSSIGNLSRFLRKNVVRQPDPSPRPVTPPRGLETAPVRQPGMTDAGYRDVLIAHSKQRK
jgi:hypothetical protein